MRRSYSIVGLVVCGLYCVWAAYWFIKAGQTSDIDNAYFGKMFATLPGMLALQPIEIYTPYKASWSALCGISMLMAYGLGALLEMMFRPIWQRPT